MEDVVGLRRWIEKVEKVFEICKCVEEDKVMFAASTFEGRALTWLNENVHTLRLVNANCISWLTTLHDAINMARELVKQVVQVELQELVKAIKGSRKTNKGTTITSKDKKLLRLMLQPRLKVEATLGTYHGAIGVEGTSSAMSNVTCFGCGEKGHYMDKCPRGINLKNKGARGRAYVMRTQEPHPNPNVIADLLSTRLGSLEEMEGPCHGESSHLEFFYNGSTLVYRRMPVTVSLSIHLICYRHQLNSGDQSSLRGIDCEILLHLEYSITSAPILLTLPNRFKTIQGIMMITKAHLEAFISRRKASQLVVEKESGFAASLAVLKPKRPKVDKAWSE
nr:hypothetical protein [Tanacetum cinerariifolium]